MNKYIILLLLSVSLVHPQSDISNTLKDNITSENLTTTVEYLTSPELAGRLPGHIGYQKAAEFIKDEFTKLKLSPGGDNNSYFQKLKVEYNDIYYEEPFSIITNDTSYQFTLGKDYVYRGFSGSGNFTANTVFCGYGLSQQEIGYDDYADINVKGKVVVVFKYNPSWKMHGKNFINGNPREKAIVAAQHGAVGILFVSFPNDKNPQAPIGSVIHGEGEQMIDFPEIHIDLQVADILFYESGFTLKELQTKIDENKKPFSIELKNKVKIEVKTNYVKEQEVVNVVGVLKGTDEKYKNEYVIIGAHLDHVGQQAGKIYFPGANDNASGSAAVLEIARAYAQSGIKPKRSIAFVLFASEEQGLYGSKYYSENLPCPVENVTAMFNMDCVGHGDSIQVGGGESAVQLWKTVNNIDSVNGKMMVNKTWKGGGADAEYFYQKEIPSIYFVTTNSYTHLHMMSDKLETLNKDLYEKITELAALSLYEITSGNYTKEIIIK